MVLEGLGVIIGIDLGTTNCACAVFRNGEAEMIPNSLGHLLTPSAVSVSDAGEVITGLAARERQATHPEATVTAFKRYMGSNHVTRLGGLSFSPEELSALMLRALKTDAEAFLGEMVEEAVITVPAYFNDKQRKATKRAGQLAGLKVERLVNEPTAAALAYGIHERGREARFLVFDLGGGTFDVSILEIFEGVIEVRATAGDNRLGGEDFNEILIGMAVARMPTEISKAVKENALYQKLRESAERTRRALTSSEFATFTVVWNDQKHVVNISSDAFEAACEPILNRLKDPVLRSMRDSDIALGSLTDIVLVGGATRMPVVRKAVARMFGRIPDARINPDEAVARGAAVQAGLKARDAALSEVVLTDVCPYSLGVGSSTRAPDGSLVTGIFSPILERNCVIPASREDYFSTIADNQEVVQFLIYQGESRWVDDNIYIGEISVRVPRMRAGQVQIICRFSYDINGLLEVDLMIPDTGAQKQLVVADRDNVSAEEIDKRRQALAKLKIHPRDQDANRSTLSRAGRCYENAIGDQRDYINHIITQFEMILNRQDPRACEAARIELEKLLDEVEGRTFL